MGVAQRLVRWIANSVMRFRLPSPTLKDGSANFLMLREHDVVGSSPILRIAHVAQLAEHVYNPSCFYGLVVQWFNTSACLAELLIIRVIIMQENASELNPSQIGLITELKCITYLLERNYNVLLP